MKDLHTIILEETLRASASAYCPGCLVAMIWCECQSPECGCGRPQGHEGHCFDQESFKGD